MNASRWGVEKFAAANTEMILLCVTAKARTVSILLCAFVLPSLSRLISQASAHAWSLINEKSKEIHFLCSSGSPFGMCSLQQIGTLLYD